MSAPGSSENGPSPAPDEWCDCPPEICTGTWPRADCRRVAMREVFAGLDSESGSVGAEHKQYVVGFMFNEGEARETLNAIIVNALARQHDWDTAPSVSVEPNSEEVVEEVLVALAPSSPSEGEPVAWQVYCVEGGGRHPHKWTVVLQVEGSVFSPHLQSPELPKKRAEGIRDRLISFLRTADATYMASEGEGAREAEPCAICGHRRAEHKDSWDHAFLASQAPARVCPECGDGPLSTDADLPYCQNCGHIEAPAQREEKP